MRKNPNYIDWALKQARVLIIQWYQSRLLDQLQGPDAQRARHRDQIAYKLEALRGEVPDRELASYDDQVTAMFAAERSKMDTAMRRLTLQRGKRLEGPEEVESKFESGGQRTEARELGNINKFAELKRPSARMTEPLWEHERANNPKSNPYGRVYLRGVGWVAGIPAAAVQPGMVLLETREKVVRVSPSRDKVTLTTVDERNRIGYDTRLRNEAVAARWPKEKE